MTQIPHDQLAKQYLEEFLTSLGNVQRQYEVPGEAKYIDVWFVPDRPRSQSPEDLGLLDRITQWMCLLEPYRNAPTRTEIRISLMKLLWVQDDEQRKAKQADQPLSESELPTLWILATTVSQPLLDDANGLTKADWLPGIYFMAELLKTAIVAIDELPETDETLWLRVLGRGETQKRAIEEVLALPTEHPRRNTILRLLASWRVRIDMGELEDFADREEIMALSEAFLAWEQQTEAKAEAKGRQEEKLTIARNLLHQRMAIELVAQATGLSIGQIEDLANENPQ